MSKCQQCAQRIAHRCNNIRSRRLGLKRLGGGNQKQNTAKEKSTSRCPKCGKKVRGLNHDAGCGK